MADSMDGHLLPYQNVVADVIVLLLLLLWLSWLATPVYGTLGLWDVKLLKTKQKQ